MSESELAAAAAFNVWVRRTADQLGEAMLPDERLADMMATIRAAAAERASGDARYAFEQVLEQTGTESFVAVREALGRVNPAAAKARRAADLYGLQVFSEEKPREPDQARRGHLVPLGDGPSEHSGFGLDQTAVHELLLGTQLYQDRGLALRELYQNALDACRYRKARYEYLARARGLEQPYAPEINFTQDRDEAGRAFLECADNGVGMGEDDIRNLFSRAGTRFVDSAGFRAEMTEWQQCDPPVTFRHNSRFGIGVFSYFMLANRIEVTTCRMDRDGVNGPELTFAIDSPSAVYRIVRVRDRGEPGTRIRLLLQDPPTSDDGDPRTSYLEDALDRTLGIAEFPTSFTHGESKSVWAPGELRPNCRPSPRGETLRIAGWTVPCLEGQVIWCEDGGALLVDGLLVEPATSGELFTNTGRGALHGVVVNLSATRPLTLSVDRRRVVSDVSVVVRQLLTEAADELVSKQGRLVTTVWLDHVEQQSPAVAAILRAALARRSSTKPSRQ